MSSTTSETSGDTVAHCALLTGLPRSGTTLTCHLLNRIPNTIALHEPMRVKIFEAPATAEQRLATLGDYLRTTRGSLLADGTAHTKHVGGKVPDNPAAQQRSESGLRKSIAERGDVHFDKELTDDFLLVVKHPAAFSAMLPTLSRHYRCFAAVRNPLSVLGSWNSVAYPIHRGHIPAAERIDVQLNADLAAMKDVHDRQFHILAWFFARFLDNLPRESIFRYEDTVESGGRSLAPVNPAAADLDEPLSSKNRNKLYSSELVQTLGKRLLATDGPWWQLYERADVERILETA